MKVVLTLMSSFYWMDIGICDRVFEVDVKAGYAKVTFSYFVRLFIQNLISLLPLFLHCSVYNAMFPCIQLFVCLAACRPRICSRNLCLHFQLFATFFSFAGLKMLRLWCCWGRQCRGKVGRTLETSRKLLISKRLLLQCAIFSASGEHCFRK